MARASAYNVSFPWGATTSPYSRIHPHSGDDRACPIGTETWVGDTLVSKTGNTGQTTGPHIHIQRAIYPYVAPYLNPQGKGLENTIAFPAIVIEVGEKADIGKYARVMDANMERWTYCHNSEVFVKVGQTINKGSETFMASESKPYNSGDVTNVANTFSITKTEAKGKKDWNDVFYAIVVPQVEALNAKIKELEDSLNADKNAKAIQALKDALYQIVV